MPRPLLLPSSNTLLIGPDAGQIQLMSSSPSRPAAAAVVAAAGRLVLGEDVERSTIGTTKGLIEKFGPTRVRNTPISENGVLSACVGAAASGVRPVFDIMFSSFFYVCLDAIANHDYGSVSRTHQGNLSGDHLLLDGVSTAA